MMPSFDESDGPQYSQFGGASERAGSGQGAGMSGLRHATAQLHALTRKSMLLLLHRPMSTLFYVLVPMAATGSTANWLTPL